MSGVRPATPIESDAALAAIAAQGAGFVIDRFNRWWHRASCPRVKGMTTGEPKWFAETRAAVDRSLADRLARYPTARPIQPCRTCRPGDASVRVAAETRPQPEPAAYPTDPLRVTQTASGFVAAAAHRVTFGPRSGSPAEHVRTGLCELLPALVPREGETLHAVFGGSIPANSDLENQLIYNVFDGPSTYALARGVRFEIDDAEPRHGFEYRYEIGPAGAPFRHWQQGPWAARWSGVLLPDGPVEHLLSRTWWALHAAEVELGRTLLGRSRFGLRLCVWTPARTPARLNPERVKKLLDGVVSAFQRHDASDEAISRIAARLARDSARVRLSLTNAERAVLGPAERPIGLTGEDVQWNPDDTRLVAAEISLNTSQSTAVEISGSVFAVEG